MESISHRCRTADVITQGALSLQNQSGNSYSSIAIQSYCLDAMAIKLINSLHSQKATPMVFIRLPDEASLYLFLEQPVATYSAVCGAETVWAKISSSALSLTLPCPHMLSVHAYDASPPPMAGTISRHLTFLYVLATVTGRDVGDLWRHLIQGCKTPRKQFLKNCIGCHRIAKAM